MKKILVIGSLNLDMVVNVDHTPVAGETILSDGMELIPGGKGANQAYGAGCLGADVTMLGAVGDDAYGDILLGSLKKAGVNVSRILRRDDSPTGIAIITVNREGDNSIVVAAGANGTLSREDLDRNLDLFKDSDMILFQLEIPMETVLYGAAKAKELGKTVILDPAPAPKRFPTELYQYVDIIKPNETELEILTGMEITEDNLFEAAEVLRSHGVKEVIVTFGGRGVFLNSEKWGTMRVPAKKVTAVDTTAAGDSFTAALAVMLSQNKNLKEAVEFANRVAAIVVTRKGAQSSIPRFEEVLCYKEI